MKWCLTKTKKKRKIKNDQVANNILELELKKQTINVCHQKIIDSALLKIIEKDLNKVITKIIDYLSSEEDDSTETTLLFDELAKLRGIYREYDKKMSAEAVRGYMKKIRFAALELKKRLVTYSYEKPVKSKSR